MVFLMLVSSRSVYPSVGLRLGSGAAGFPAGCAAEAALGAPVAEAGGGTKQQIRHKEQN